MLPQKASKNEMNSASAEVLPRCSIEGSLPRRPNPSCDPALPPALPASTAPPAELPFQQRGAAGPGAHTAAGAEPRQGPRCLPVSQGAGARARPAQLPHHLWARLLPPTLSRRGLELREPATSYLPDLVRTIMAPLQHLKDASTAPTAAASLGSQLRGVRRRSSSNSCL